LRSTSSLSRRPASFLERLLDKSDVLVENFRPGVMDRLGYGAEHWQGRIHISSMASISGFGHTGPFKDLPAL